MNRVAQVFQRTETTAPYVLLAYTSAWYSLRRQEEVPMLRRYTPTELAEIAKCAAEARGRLAVRWWRDERDPWLLQVEAQGEERDGEPDMALLTAFLGE
jgi:hypothetical protein